MAVVSDPVNLVSSEEMVENRGFSWRAGSNVGKRKAGYGGKTLQLSLPDIARSCSKLLAEAFREIGGRTESNHIGNFRNRCGILAEQIHRPVESEVADELACRQACQRR